jgi:hypothetical protein
MKYVSIFLIGVFFIGCDAFVDEQDVPQELIGEWEWTSSAGVWSGLIIADSVDYSMTLIFKGNKATWYRDHDLQAKFDVEKNKESWRPGSVYLKKNQGIGCSYSGVLEKAKQSLELIPSNCLDAPSHYFKKISS